MASKLVGVLLISSAAVVIMVATLASVSNLISATICISVTDLKKLMGNMASMAGSQMNLPATAEPNSQTCDYQMSVSFGIWRCRVHAESPMDYTWEGSYATLGDQTETGFEMMKSMAGQTGIDKMFEDKAGEALGDLLRTLYIRAEIQMALTVMFAILAVVLTAVNLSERGGMVKQLVATFSALCHVITAILLGVTLGGFAQELHQLSSMADVYAMIKVTDEGHGFLVVGFAAVLASIILALAQLMFLVCHLKKQDGRKSDVDYKLILQQEDSP